MITDLTEIRILTALRRPHHTGWLGPIEVAQALDLPSWQVRSVLVELRKRFLVKRGNAVLGHWGEYSITENGIQELAASSQLRLVGGDRVA